MPPHDFSPAVQVLGASQHVADGLHACECSNSNGSTVGGLPWKSAYMQSGSGKAVVRGGPGLAGVHLQVHSIELFTGPVWSATSGNMMWAPSWYPTWSSKAALQAGMARLGPTERPADQE